MRALVFSCALSDPKLHQVLSCVSSCLNATTLARSICQHLPRALRLTNATPSVLHVVQQHVYKPFQFGCQWPRLVRQSSVA